MCQVKHKKHRKYGRYLRVLMPLIVIMSGLGWLLNGWMTGVSSTEVESNQLNTLFPAAITYMQQGNHRQAEKLWHQLLLSNPEIPEVKVNMGFTLFNQERYVAARDFFLSAIEQNAYQSNAYYGLAICSEKTGDLVAALGAMKSYIHLALKEQDAPYVRKAEAAIWEWESQLAAIGADSSSPDPARQIE